MTDRKFQHVFVLCTGRCGSMGLAKAAQQFENYSAGHETRTHLLGFERFNYALGHIEVDNRLAWLLGRLQARYGDAAFYVHLKRDPIEVAQSYAKRSGWLIDAYHKNGILMGCHDSDLVKVAFDMVQTIEANIEVFLKDKSNKMIFNIKNAEEDFKAFAQNIGAKGDIEKGIEVLAARHNASERQSK